MPSVAADRTSRSDVIVAALSDRSIAVVSTPVFPVKNCCVGAASIGVSENANRQAAALRGSARKESESEVRLEHGDRSRTRPRTNLQDASRTNQAFIKVFHGWNQHSPVRSGMFPTRPSPRTPISAVSEARSTFAANPSSTRTASSRAESTRMARSAQAADGGDCEHDFQRVH